MTEMAYSTVLKCAVFVVKTVDGTVRDLGPDGVLDKPSPLPTTPSRQRGAFVVLGSLRTPKGLELNLSRLMAATMVMRLILPVPPSLNRYYRTFRGRILLSAEGRAYKTLAAGLALQQGAKPIAGPIAVSVWVYRPAKRGDLDNYAKCLLDSLAGGVCYGNDDQIIEAHWYRGDDKGNPRVIVEVSRIEDQPTNSGPQ